MSDLQGGTIVGTGGGGSRPADLPGAVPLRVSDAAPRDTARPTSVPGGRG